MNEIAVATPLWRCPGKSGEERRGDSAIFEYAI